MKNVQLVGVAACKFALSPELGRFTDAEVQDGFLLAVAGTEIAMNVSRADALERYGKLYDYLVELRIIRDAELMKESNG